LPVFPFFRLIMVSTHREEVQQSLFGSGLSESPTISWDYLLPSIVGIATTNEWRQRRRHSLSSGACAKDCTSCRRLIPSRVGRRWRGGHISGLSWRQHAVTTTNHEATFCVVVVVVVVVVSENCFPCRMNLVREERSRSLVQAQTLVIQSPLKIIGENWEMPWISCKRLLHYYR